MNLLPSIASIADLFTRPLPTISHHRHAQIVVGDDPIAPSPLSASAHFTATVDLATVAPPTLVATTVDSLTAVVDPASTSVPSLHPNLVPYDTGASISRTSAFALEISQAPCGLIRSAFDTSVTSDSVASNSKAYSKVASTPVDPHTLITGEDPTFDLSFPDSDSVDAVEFASTLVYSSFRQFGTATLVFLSDANSKLITVLVEPTQVDWIHWVPLPRLTPTESYCHTFGRDYLQAFALLHLIPLWIALVFALLRSE